MNEKEGERIRDRDIFWGSPGLWREVNQSISYLIDLYCPALVRAAVWARYVRQNLKAIFPLMDELGMNACPWCPEPCCISASVRFDFRDLLFLHLSHQFRPEAQLISDPNETCRYLTPKGCALPRMSRPWACTWYLCPTQITRLRAKTSEHDAFQQRVILIKTGRQAMEDAFISISTPNCHPIPTLSGAVVR